MIYGISESKRDLPCISLSMKTKWGKITAAIMRHFAGTLFALFTVIGGTDRQPFSYHCYSDSHKKFPDSRHLTV